MMMMMMVVVVAAMVVAVVVVAVAVVAVGGLGCTSVAELRLRCLFRLASLPLALSLHRMYFRQSNCCRLIIFNNVRRI